MLALRSMRYFNLMLKGKPMGCIMTMCPHDGQALRDALCEEYPEAYGEYFVLYEGAETEETYGDAYERGLIMYAMECSRKDNHPLLLDDEDIIRTIDDWQPCLTACKVSPDAMIDLWQEGYATWGDAMRDAEEKWNMLPEWFKNAVRSGGRGAFFELRKGLNGEVVRDWAKDYSPVEVTMPRNRVGIQRTRGNIDYDRKTICYTLIPCQGSGVDYLTALGMVLDKHGLGHKDQLSTRSKHIRFNNILYNCASGKTYVTKGETTELFDYDGFMPIQNIRYILKFLPSISYRNEWTHGEMTFVDDGELDRALEANKDWLAHMEVKVTRLEDTMKARPDVFEGTYLGDVWVWEHTY